MCLSLLAYNLPVTGFCFRLFGCVAMSLDIVILAAGQGTRMRSALPKVLHPVADKPMLAHVLDTARSLQPQTIHVVIGHAAEAVRERIVGEDLTFVTQREQLGTGHAVVQALPGLHAERVLILYGDVPLIETDTLQRLLSRVDKDQLALLTVELADATGYGRILRDASGRVRAIVEHKDASDEQRRIREGNTGILAVPGKPLADWLARLSNHNAQGEYYLTDIIAMAVDDGLSVATEQAASEMEVLGANDRLQLAQLERHYQRRMARRLMLQGVTLRDPERFDVRGQVSVGRDVNIDINVILEGRVIIEDEVQIGANCLIKDSVLRRGAVVKANSQLDGAELGEGADCGPFARLRPGSVLGAKAHVGNFVELKNAVLGEGAKAGHLSYLGDAEIGARSNIGAGTITCNYDGAQKHRTRLGQDVSVGSNTALVAPVTVGDRATTGAGSVINQDVPSDTLAVARARQCVIEGWKRPSKS
jgi:bifunctional UDP-N-acetylglucosamine pyrophosphorylase/glucosamine-1-phosphate N-acetyltransferase